MRAELIEAKNTTPPDRQRYFYKGGKTYTIAKYSIEVNAGFLVVSGVISGVQWWPITWGHCPPAPGAVVWNDSGESTSIAIYGDIHENTFKAYAWLGF